MMHRTLTSRWLSRALRTSEQSSVTRIPEFLCPAISSASITSNRVFQTSRKACLPVCQRRHNHGEATVASDAVSGPTSESSTAAVRDLPVNCPGCGAFAQTQDPHGFGYYNTTSKRVKQWLRTEKRELTQKDSKEDDVVREALKGLEPAQLEELGLDPGLLLSAEEGEETNLPDHASEKLPVCDRCHNLIHHSHASDTAKMIMHHPTVESLRETIEESPHKYNHIYHVIDAADFPMSLIPRLNVLLGDVELRTRNRRSRASKYHNDRKTEMSFIITRADLLGPTKDIVDSMMPYLREVLRDALGRVGNRVRLGNVSCVSAKRGWWTSKLREEIWKRGGAGWMVGKVNVGKSQLFEAVYPKGRLGGNPGHESSARGAREEMHVMLGGPDRSTLDQDDADVGELLPPLQPVQMYPAMPIVSSLPGTTASPIRVPFGNGKGELVDLPGLSRSDLELFVQEKHRKSLIMQTRIVPEQQSLQLGSSLLLGGGLIRITPRTPGLTFLCYNFTPLPEHLTSTEKAAAFQDQTRESVGLTNITLPEMGEKMKHAGTFKLIHDVTKIRAGPLTNRNAVGLSVDRLAFRVLSVDILIEGVGYVEIVAQIRAKDLERFPPLEQPKPTSEEPSAQEKPEKLETSTAKDPSDPFAALESLRRDHDSPATPAEPRKVYDLEWPAVDVYSPEGRFVGSRRPINGWMRNKPLVRQEHKRSRPRRSMKGQKKKQKQARRATQQAAGGGAM